MNNKHLSKLDYEYMRSLSEAVLSQTPRKTKVILWFWFIFIFAFIVWASFASIDEITRGEGEIVPSGENQLIQNLEGGIVKEIFVKEGSIVKKGQILLKLENQKSKSTMVSNQIKINELEAKMIRLKAEASQKPFKPSSIFLKRFPRLLKNEQSLFLSNKNQYIAKASVLKSQVNQKKSELQEAQSSLKHLKKSYDLVNEELTMSKPLVIEGIKSKVDYLKLKRELNEIDQKYQASVNSIPRLKAGIQEISHKTKEIEFTFINKAKEELNKVYAELQRIKASDLAYEDQVYRTMVKSPVNGVIQKLYVHTVGGVIKPGADLVELVPTDNSLLVEVKIKPSDIAFLYPGLQANIKISAYDFAIFGGLIGEVVNISADTVKNEKNETFYKVLIKTKQNFIRKDDNQLKIIPGMVAQVDIVTGKKTILDYILKPILKTKQYTFSER